MCQNHNIKTRPGIVDIGIRYELPDKVMEDINKYMYEGKFIGRPYPFKDKVRTFCQNPSGFVSSEVYDENIALVNGHSYWNIVIQRLGDIFRGKRTWKEELEKNSVVPTLKSAVAGDITFAIGYRTMSDIINFICEMDKVVEGFAAPDNLLYGPEIKFYSNELVLNKNFESSVKGLFAMGDGCGMTRGLMMASSSGVQMARIIEQ